MRRIKIFLLSGLCTLFFAVTANAQDHTQDINRATEFYNNGAKAVQANDWATAIAEFDQALAILEPLGQEGEEISQTIKELIPSLHFYLGEEFAKSDRAVDAIAELKKAIATAEQFDDLNNTAQKAAILIKQINTRAATNLLNEKKYEEAIVAYKELLEGDPENGTFHFCIGVSYYATGKEANAIAALEKASELGAKNADGQLVNIYLRKAQAAAAAKKFDDMFASAEKVLAFDANNVNGNKLLGQAAFELKRWDAAISAYEKVLPLESNPDNTLYNLARAHENKGNKAKACENYKKLVTSSNAQLKAFAEAKVKELCN